MIWRAFTAVVYAIVCLTLVCEADERRIALVIGANDYQHLPQQQYGNRDAQEIGASLMQVGFEVTTLMDPSRDSFWSAVVNFRNELEQAGDDAVGFFYFAGMGASTANDNFYIPVDASISTENELAAAGISQSVLIAILGELETKAVFIVSDMCRDRPFSLTRGLVKTRYRSPTPHDGMLIANSASEGGLAYNDGVYARALARNILRENMFASRAFALAGREVAEVRRSDSFPEFVDRLTEDFCFVSCPVDEDSQTNELGLTEEVFHDRIAASLRYCEDYSKYISDYGDEAKYSNFARLKIAGNCEKNPDLVAPAPELPEICDAPASPPAKSPFEQRHALIITNESYPDSIGRLRRPHEDGVEVAEALCSVGFTVTRVSDADEQGIVDAVTTFSESVRTAGEDGVAVFYYAGHGLGLDAGEGLENWMIPAKTTIESRTQLRTNGVPLERGVISPLAKASKGSVFVFFDACRNELNMENFDRNTRGYVPVSERSGLYVAFSGPAGETVADDGLFAEILADNLPLIDYEADRAIGVAMRTVAEQRLQKLIRQREVRQESGDVFSDPLPSVNDLIPRVSNALAVGDPICFNRCPAQSAAESVCRKLLDEGTPTVDQVSSLKALFPDEACVLEIESMVR